jgi:hypothetical protein
MAEAPQKPPQEDAAAKAKRLVEMIQARLKQQKQTPDAVVRMWLRSDPENDPK